MNRILLHRMLIDLSAYPLLLEKFENPESIVKTWIDTQYLILLRNYESQPSVELVKKVNETCSTMQCMSDNVSRQIDTLSAEQSLILQDMKSNLSKLPILLSNSSKKGKIGEKCIQEYLNESLSKEDYNIRDTSSQPRSGDFQITRKDFSCLVDSKNYSKNVSKKEVEKLERDMIENEIQTGILVSMTTGIVGYTNLDFKFFKHNDKYSCIALIGQAKDNPQKVEVAIRFLESIYDSFLKVDRSELQIDRRTEGILQLLQKEADDLSKIYESFDKHKRQIETSLSLAKDDMINGITRHQQTIKTLLMIV